MSPNKKILILYIAIFMVLLFVDKDSPGRYIKYIIPGFAISYLAFKPSYFFETSNYFIRLCYLYLVVILISLFIWILDNNNVDIRYFANGLFIIGNLSLTLYISLNYKDSENEEYVLWLFWGFLAIYILQILVTGVKLSFNFDYLIKGIISSNFDSESTYSLTFVFFPVYFLYKKKYNYFMVSVFLTILGFKRISLVALVISLLLYISLPERILNKKYFIILLAIIVNYIFIYLLINFAYGNFDPLIQEITGLSSSYIAKGRQVRYSVLLNEFGPISYVGTGIGSMDVLLSEKFVYQMGNLHSDILKNYYEFGIVLFSIWIYFLYKLGVSHRIVFILTVILNILFLSDNVFIYLHVLPVYYIIAISLNNNKTYLK